MFCKYCGKQMPDTAQYCSSCGKNIAAGDTASSAPYQSGQVTVSAPAFVAQETVHVEPAYRIGKLVIGIISLVLTMVILFQSCAVGLLNTLEDSGDVGGTAGILLVLCWWIAGILGIAGKKNRTATIVGAVFYGLAALFAFGNAAVFSDLIVWGILSLIFAGVFALSATRLVPAPQGKS